MTNLKEKKVAILTENGFEEEELTSPRKELQAAGAEVQIVSPQKSKVKAWAHDHWSIELPVDVQLSKANADDFDALLIETGLISGRNMTSYASIKTDLENAGAIWTDREVVVDNGLITSRSPKDLPAFNKKVIEEIKEGKHTPAAYTPAPSH